MLYIIIIFAVALDQLTKWQIQQSMILNQSIPVWEGVFSLTYIHNTGAAFSMLTGKTALLALLQAAIIGFLLAYAIRKRRGMPLLLQTALALIIGGGAGNLIDRLCRGYVVDFLDFHVWPVFNVADISVVAGCGLLVAYVLFMEGRERKGRESRGAVH